MITTDQDRNNNDSGNITITVDSDSDTHSWLEFRRLQKEGKCTPRCCTCKGPATCGYDSMKSNKFWKHLTGPKVLVKKLFFTPTEYENILVV